MDYKQKRFEQMVNQNKRTIYTLVYMISIHSDEVADLFQETLINLWKGMPEKDEISNIKGWIYRVSLNTCISLNRKKKSRPTVPLTMDIDLFESKGEKEQQVEMLHKRITRLQPFDRAIVLLWLEDISYEEIGLILGITAKNVSVRLTRIREKLKQMSNE